MRRTQYGEEQVAYAWRQGESGAPVADVRRQLGIRVATFTVRKKKLGHFQGPGPAPAVIW